MAACALSQAGDTLSRNVTCNINQLGRLLEKDLERIRRADLAARRRTAARVVPIVKRAVPRAFGELQESVTWFDNGGNPVTAAEAPHAGAVEIGSAPHKPDFEALLKWVRLRGLQGLTDRGRIRSRFKKSMGPTTRYQARRVASMIRDEQVRGGRKDTGSFTGKSGRFTPSDAAVKVARAIAKGIEEHGTRPHWYMRSAVPKAAEILLEEVSRRIKI